MSVTETVTRQKVERTANWITTTKEVTLYINSVEISYEKTIHRTPTKKSVKAPKKKYDPMTSDLPTSRDDEPEDDFDGDCKPFPQVSKKKLDKELDEIAENIAMYRESQYKYDEEAYDSEGEPYPKRN